MCCITHHQDSLVPGSQLGLVHQLSLQTYDFHQATLITHSTHGETLSGPMERNIELAYVGMMAIQAQINAGLQPSNFVPTLDFTPKPNEIVETPLTSMPIIDLTPMPNAIAETTAPAANADGSGWSGWSDNMFGDEVEREE